MDDKESITHLRWMHTTIAGFSISFFLVLFSGFDQIQNSKMLYISIIFFAAAIPFSTACALFHFYAVEQNIPFEVIKRVANSHRATLFTQLNLTLVTLGFTFLVGHYSVIAFFVFIALSFLCRQWLQPFLAELKQFSEPLSYNTVTFDEIKTHVHYKGHQHKKGSN
ncbi:hypothetical protein D2H34_003572 [Vibrio fluvialis]